MKRITNHFEDSQLKDFCSKCDRRQKAMIKKMNKDIILNLKLALEMSLIIPKSESDWLSRNLQKIIRYINLELILHN